MMSNIGTPTSIRRLEKDGLEITWPDGKNHIVSCKMLRSNCPCAVCRMERGDSGHDAPLTPVKKPSLKIIEHSSEESLTLTQIWAIGNYALGLKWGDGHDSGIYTFDLLKSLD